jgi:hypothetical protein
VPVCVIVNESSSDTLAQLAKHGVDYMFTTGSKFHPHGADGIYCDVKYIADAKNLPIIELALLKHMADNILTPHYIAPSFSCHTQPRSHNTVPQGWQRSNEFFDASMFKIFFLN